jgi:hypothetical protein
MKKLIVINMALIVMFFSGCRIPKEQKEKAIRMEQKIAQTKKLVTQKETAHKTLKASKEYKSLEVYAERETWDKYLTDSKTKAKKLTRSYTTEVNPLLEINKKKDTPTLIRYLNKYSRIIGVINKQVQVPETRAKVLLELQKNAPKKVETWEKSTKIWTNKYKVVPPEAKKVKTKYPNISAQTDEIISKQTLALKNSQSLIIKIRGNLDDSATDYGILDASLTQMAVLQKQIEANLPGLLKTLKEPYKSYTHILTDMRIDYYVTIGVSAWNESSDSRSTNDFKLRPRKVDENTFITMTKAPAVMASRYRGKMRYNVSEKYFRNAVVNPKENFSRWEDSAEYWVDDWDMKFYQKLQIVNGDKVTNSDWIEIDQEDFEPIMNALGMSILSKPYGVYEQDAIEAAHPPGIAFVGNPTYGEYREQNGRSMWHYYGQYAFFNSMMGSNRYYRDDYSHWNSNRHTNYYGRNALAPTYGTKSPLVKSSTTTAKSNWVSKGKTTSPPKTVRAGATRRSGGPKSGK